MAPAARTFHGLVRAAARDHGSAPALVEGDRRLTWAEVGDAVERTAAGYAAQGLGAGDRVAVKLRNGVDWVLAVVGALRAGLVVVPVNPAYTDPELTHLLTDSGARALVVGAPRDALAGVPVLVGPPSAEDEPPADPDDPAALALLAYTSGTTGQPRGAMLTHRALLTNQQQVLAVDPAPVRPGDVVLLALPFFHVYGLNAGVGLVAATASCGVVVPSFDPVATMALMAAEGVTAVPAAPPMYQAWLAAADAAGSDTALRRAFAAVHTASSGSAPLAPRVWTAMKDRAAVTVWEGYGLTEAAPVLATTLVTGRAKPACIGAPLPGVELVLRDTAGGPGAGPDPGSKVREDVFGDPFGDDPPDSAGEVSVRGPNLFAGYWPDGADGPDDEGWLLTGDIAYRDAQGDLHLVDRRRDLVLVSGFNVYPLEVERVLETHPEIAEAAVIGLPDERTGEAVRAVVVRAPGSDLDAEGLRTFAARSLARFKVPSSVLFVEQLPHSLTGKVSRARLRELGMDALAEQTQHTEGIDGGADGGTDRG